MSPRSPRLAPRDGIRLRRSGGQRLLARGEVAHGPRRADCAYVRSLLLAFAQPTRFALGELGQARFCIDRYAHLASLDPIDLAGEADQDTARFLVRPGAARPGFPLHPHGGAVAQQGDLIMTFTR